MQAPEDCLVEVLAVRPGDGDLYLAEQQGRVVRLQSVSQNLRGVRPSGFAVRLTEAPEQYFHLLANLFGLRFAS